MTNTGLRSTAGQKTSILRLGSLLCSASCSGALFLSGPASAQDAGQTGLPAISPLPAASPDIVVTGTRLRSPNSSATSPTTVVNRQEIELQGTTNVEDLLNSLPQVSAGQTSSVSNGSDGTATVNLRRLSSAQSSRTLVLVDGKRLEPGDPTNGGAADLNNIPAALVQRVDVVTGGASAVYGSDAVAGVVNFILDKNFQGFRIDAVGSFANHSQHNREADRALASAPYYSGPVTKPADVTADGATYDVTATVGTNFAGGRGNITVYAGYRRLDPVLQTSRDFSSCLIGTDTASYTTHVCTGSSNSAYGRFDNTGPHNAITGLGTMRVLDNPDGSKTFVPLNGAAAAYNATPLNYLQRSDDLYRAGFFAHYEVSKAFELYSDFMFMDDKTNGQFAPSGFFGGTGPNLNPNYTFNCNNPLIGSAQVAALCPGVVVTPGASGGATTTTSIRYRFASSPRNENFGHSDFKIDVGARGDLGDGWRYDAYLQYGRTDVRDVITGYASTAKLSNALNVINDPATGIPRCVTNDPGCAPLDIFAANGKNFSSAALAYVLVPGISVSDQVEKVASASITGNIGQYGFKSPFATDGIGVSVGVEYRSEAISITNDEELISGDLSGSDGPTASSHGSFNVKEIFGEARLPFVSDKPFARDLSLNIGGRYSDYSTSGGTTTYKAELNYAPVSDVRFRASYNRAVRAASAIELFAGQLPNHAGYQDPCSGTSPTLSQGQCQLTGLNPGLYGLVTPCASATCSTLTGGNPALKPETADTYSAGIVFTPTFVRNFDASIDYFHIKIKDVIGAGLGPAAIVSACAGGSTIYCGLIHRDSAGTLDSAQGYVGQINQNSGSLRTSGIDFVANYRTQLGSLPGTILVGLVTTYTHDLTFEPMAGQGTYNCAGLFGLVCHEPLPKWKGQVRLSWASQGGAIISLNWRFIGSTKFDGNTPNKFLAQSFYDAADARIPMYNYFDLSGSVKLFGQYTLRAGVKNIFDKDPPLLDQNNIGITATNIVSLGNGNTFPGTYDSLGRTFFAALSIPL